MILQAPPFQCFSTDRPDLNFQGRLNMQIGRTENAKTQKRKRNASYKGKGVSGKKKCRSKWFKKNSPGSAVPAEKFRFRA